jgi:hypothetical protein
MADLLKRPPPWVRTAYSTDDDAGSRPPRPYQRLPYELTPRRPAAHALGSTDLRSPSAALCRSWRLVSHMAANHAVLYQGAGQRSRRGARRANPRPHSRVQRSTKSAHQAANAAQHRGLHRQASGHGRPERRDPARHAHTPTGTRTLAKSVFPTFDRFLLFALLNGMILGRDADLRHPHPDDRGACRGRLAAAVYPPARLRQPSHLPAAAAGLAARRRVAAVAAAARCA